MKTSSNAHVFFRKSARADNITMMARVEEVKRLVSQNQEAHELILHLSQDQTTQLDALTERMKKQEGNTETILSQLRGTLCAVLEIKDKVNHIFKAIIDFRLLLLNQTIPRPLDPTRNLPLIVEDALGTVMEIPLDLVHSWEVMSLFSHGRIQVFPA